MNVNQQETGWYRGFKTYICFTFFFGSWGFGAAFLGAALEEPLAADSFLPCPDSWLPTGFSGFNDAILLSEIGVELLRTGPLNPSVHRKHIAPLFIQLRDSNLAQQQVGEGIRIISFTQAHWRNVSLSKMKGNKWSSHQCFGKKSIRYLLDIYADLFLPSEQKPPWFFWHQNICSFALFFSTGSSYHKNSMLRVITFL